MNDWCWLGVNFNPLNSSDPFVILDDNEEIDKMQSFLKETNIWENNKPDYNGDNFFAEVILGANGKLKVVDENENNVYLVCRVQK